MHEFSLTQALLEQVRAIAREQAATAVTEVVVAVGPLAGIEPLLVQSAFAQLASGDLMGAARLTIEPQPLTIHCSSCGQESRLVDFEFICRHCRSRDTRVVGGDALILRQIVLEQPAEEAIP